MLGLLKFSVLGIALWAQISIYVAIGFSLLFAIAALLEIFFGGKGSTVSKKVIREDKKPVQFVTKNDFKKEEVEIDLDSMLEKLEQKSKASREEVKEEPKALPVKVENEKSDEESIREFVERHVKTTEEVSYVEESAKKNAEPVIIEKTIVETRDGLIFDYDARLAKMNDSLSKLEKDLTKNNREVSKYEKTQVRKGKNEKLLNKKTQELTNLNLVLYNINDIRNIDPEKKAKQEELVAHIADLKSSIKDADAYLVANKGNFANAKKLSAFLTKERERIMDEISQLETLIAEAKKRKK